MKISTPAAIVALSMIATTAAQATDPVVVKTATVLPDGTVWYQAVKDMGAEWGTATSNRVTMRLYAGGIAGDDPDMLRKMRVGQLQAGVISMNGLAEIDQAFKVFRLPLFFASYEELRSVLTAMTPDLEKRLAAKGFVLLNWSEVGWVYLFSAKPVATVPELKTSKMFSFAGDDQMTSWWKQQGFQPVAISTTDIPTALQTGMLQTMPTTPLAALTLQWYRQLPNMLQLGMGPLLGGTILTKKTWDAISPEDQKRMLEAAGHAEKRLQEEASKQDKLATDEMVKRGLKVVTLDTAQEAVWRMEAGRLLTTMRGVVVPADAYDTALKLRDEFRKLGAKPATKAAAKPGAAR